LPWHISEKRTTAVFVSASMVGCGGPLGVERIKTAMATTVIQAEKQIDAESRRERYLQVRGTSLRITADLSAEDQMLQSMPDASPVKWHLAHTTWFFETFILSNFSGYRPFDDRYRQLFNSYYKQIGGHPLRSTRGLMSRPSLEEVLEYRGHVDRVMIAEMEGFKSQTLDLVELGLNHEQQHQELICTDIKHGLWSSSLTRDRLGDKSDLKAPRLGWIDVQGGIHSIGHDGGGFAFDNEGPRHEVLLQPLRIGSRLVTNAEYVDFINDGGYSRPELWLSEGWDTICAQRWNAPLYWELDEDGSWRQFIRRPDEFGMKPLNPDEPVCHVSYFEADAYARWAGKRLPTEAEWEVAAGKNAAKGTLLEEDTFHPQPVRGSGLQQMIGDVWEWTASAYNAYPGFRTAAGAIGEYNGKFMCNQFVLRGGSCVTPASHIRPSYRNFFPPHARWQFSGIRLADDRS